MVKNLSAIQQTQIWFLGWEDTLEKGMATHSIFLPGEFHGQRSLVGYSPWGCIQLDTTEWYCFGSDTPKYLFRILNLQLPIIDWHKLNHMYLEFINLVSFTSYRILEKKQRHVYIGIIGFFFFLTGKLIISSLHTWLTVSS